MLEDKKDRLWVGVDNKLYLYDNSRFTPVPGFEGQPTGLVYSMAESSDHTVWGSFFFRNSLGLFGSRMGNQCRSSGLRKCHRCIAWKAIQAAASG